MATIRGKDLSKPATKVDAAEVVLAKIAAMPEHFRELAERVHRLILSSAPALQPRTWYGMPGYAKDGKTICFFRADQRYMTFGFTQEAGLACDVDAAHRLIESSWFFTELDEPTEAKLRSIIAKIAK
jgi:hypothetical protein